MKQDEMHRHPRIVGVDASASALSHHKQIHNHVRRFAHVFDFLF
jgi:hypothetical protein